MELRAARRDRAARNGVELFLYERVFADCLDRLTLIPHRFRRALLIGCPDAEWPMRLGSKADRVDVRDPGRVFAQAAEGDIIVEDHWLPPSRAYDLVLAIGTLDSVNDLPLALRLIAEAMTEDGLLLGAISGGDTLPALRAAMRAADALTGVAAPHVHPRVEASSLAPLLSSAGLTMAVVDVDRVEVRYRAFRRLVGDLRAMGVTNILAQRPRQPLNRRALAAAEQAFHDAGKDGKTVEEFEIIHFSACKGSPRLG